MRHSLIQLAVLSVLGATTVQVFAAPPSGFKNLPTTGFPVGSNTSAYTTCNTTGNYGSGISTNPTVTDTTNATCAVANRSPINETQPPSTATGYALTPVASAVRTLTMNNAYTGGVAKNIGTVLDIVWRNSTNTECIYGTKVSLTATDYNALAAGNQYFEANDIARGGFGTRPVAVAFAPSQTATGEVVFRAGRTFTSVQHRPTGYSDQPLTLPAFTGSINGLDDTGSGALGTASAAQQTASLNTNWVDLTTDVNARDDDGSTKAVSHMTYIHSTCTAAAPVAVANAIRVRQTFQERSTDGANAPANQRFIEVSTTGFVPPGGVATPAPVVPF